ncbi:hypothetical protein CMV_019642 [Castanea mollissima]|uniref:Uncharacterized protein n=1 Tax=Castanea mollissima TaxID=60419 RepID=A0A8J4QPL1_9ROSI|nr:hypothetical protein CMV_019642 [Castanea mollissima]
MIWKAQNPWTGLSDQLNDHLLHQSAGFYGCRCAAKPIHVLLNLATYFIEQVGNTTSEELSNIAIEVSVWDLEDNDFSLVSSKVIPIKITFKVPPGVML